MWVTYIKVCSYLAFCIAVLVHPACKEVDQIPPVITLIGPDSVIHVLNQPYVDQGAKALDDTEGDITSKLYIKVGVNENKAGDYSVLFRVVDESGNEAVPVSRFVRVVNTSWKYSGLYECYETEVFPSQAECFFTSFVRIDSTVNDRIIFERFACDTLVNCIADIADTIIVLPFQIFKKGDLDISVQGSGWLNDSVISVEYTRKSSGETIYKNAVFNR
jgi:hypothetical protein